VSVKQLNNHEPGPVDVLIIQYPNFFGVIEAVDEICDWAHDRGMLLVAIVNPLSLGALKLPGNWGRRGADMVIYDLQTLGLPVYLSGSIAGFFSIKQRLVDRLTPAVRSSLKLLESRQVDNWMLARAEAYLGYLDDDGLSRAALQCAHNLVSLESRLIENIQLSVRFSGDRFHESVVKFDRVNLPEVLLLCARHGFQIGYPLEADYPELGQCLLVNATEVHLPADIDAMVDKLARVVEV